MSRAGKPERRPIGSTVPADGHQCYNSRPMPDDPVPPSPSDPASAKPPESAAPAPGAAVLPVQPRGAMAAIFLVAMMDFLGFGIIIPLLPNFLPELDENALESS